MKIVWLKGDYTVKKERQQQAAEAGCDFVISFHFNSANDAKANGSEIFHNERGIAETLANRLLLTITKTLKTRARGVKRAIGSRASFIRHYHCPAVLLEPCFISNRTEAEKMHDVSIVRALGEEIANEVAKWLPSSAKVGIDIGHKFKTSAPDDRGARCFFGDYEADHAEQLAKVVAASLQLR